MRRVIRRNVWETNSSTTHNIVIMTEEQAEKWENENLYYYKTGWYDAFKDFPESEKPKQGQLYTKEEVLHFYKLKGYEPDENYNDEDDPEEAFIKEMYDFIKYDWFKDSDLEMDDNYYTTPSGENIVVMCQYGYDG